MEQKQPIGLLFDSIAYYTQNSEEDIIIYSSDGDLTQLVKKKENSGRSFLFLINPGILKT